MIRFESFVTVLQGAVSQAVESVSRENINGLLQYFHPLDEADATDSKDENALAKIEKMTPRTVALEFPKMTHDGVEEHIVSVPLITLSPVQSLQVTDVQMEIDLEIVEENGDILAGFPQNSRPADNASANNEAGKSSPNSKITINIKANERPMGVTAIIEGYNKSLRAQLPN